MSDSQPTPPPPSRFAGADRAPAATERTHDLSCVQCAFLLTGLPDTGICPECGTPYAPKSLPAIRPLTTLDRVFMALFPGVIGLFVMLAIYACFLGMVFNPRGRVIFLILLIGLLAFLAGIGRSAWNIAALIEGTLKRNPDLASTRPVMFVLALLAKAIAALVLIAVGTAALIATIVHVRTWIE